MRLSPAEHQPIISWSRGCYYYYYYYYYYDDDDDDDDHTRLYLCFQFKSYSQIEGLSSSLLAPWTMLLLS